MAITQAYSKRLDKAHVVDGVGIDLEGIVEKSAAIKDTRQSLTHQHHRFRGGGRNDLWYKLLAASLVCGSQRNFRIDLRAGDRQDILPPAHHPVGFREETVAAQIDSVTAVVHRLGNTPDLAVRLKNDRDTV